jgi:hypothetical protein
MILHFISRSRDRRPPSLHRSVVRNASICVPIDDSAVSPGAIWAPSSTASRSTITLFVSLAGRTCWNKQFWRRAALCGGTVPVDDYGPLQQFGLSSDVAHQASQTAPSERLQGIASLQSGPPQSDASPGTQPDLSNGVSPPSSAPGQAPQTPTAEEVAFAVTFTRIVSVLMRSLHYKGR